MCIGSTLLILSSFPHQTFVPYISDVAVLCTCTLLIIVSQFSEQQQSLSLPWLNQVEGGASVVTWSLLLKCMDQVLTSDSIALIVVCEKVSCAMFVSLLLSMFVCFRRCVNLNKQLNTLAYREGGNDVGEHWYTQRVLTNHFFDYRVVKLGEEREWLGQPSLH